MNDCIFCQIVNNELEAHKIYEDKDVLAFLDIDPINDGHILIIPKTHFLDLDELDEEILYKIMNLSKQLLIKIKNKFHPDGYTIMQNGGVFNDIGHYHLHLFPRIIKDGFTWTDTITKKNQDLNFIKHLILNELNQSNN